MKVLVGRWPEKYWKSAITKMGNWIAEGKKKKKRKKTLKS